MRDRRNRLKLRLFGRSGKRVRRGLAAADDLCDLIEVARADFALMTRCGIADRLACKFAFLEIGVRAYAARREIVREREHAVVEGVEAGKGDELEAVAQRKEFAAEVRNRRLIEFGFPVERGRAVVREHHARELRVNARSEAPRFSEIRMRCLAPDQVAVRGVGEAA